MRHLIILFALAALAIPSAGQQLEVSTHTLSNGLKILIHEDHDIPSVAMHLFFRVGSRNERPGVTGISHFLEHMMFNGASKYGPKQFDIRMEENGGSNNAYTGRDVTVYTDWFPRSALELMMDMESDRVRGIQFDPKIVESERGVVANERRLSVDNSNMGILYEQMNAAAYIAHPYRWPIIGWASDIENYSVDDLKQHYRMGYAPNNCVMVVAGDVSATEVITLAKKYFEPIPRHDPPPPLRTREPEQHGERRVVVEKQAQLPILLVSFHVPNARHDDFIPLEVLGAILTQGRSSRLYRRMVDGEQLALSVRHYQEAALDPSQFTFTMQPRNGVDTAAAEKALFEEIELIQSKGITDQELRKAKNQLLVELYREFRTIAGKAELLGHYEVVLGDYRKLFTAGEDLDKVTAEDVKRVASEYLAGNNRTVATLIPQEASQ